MINTNITKFNQTLRDKKLTIVCAESITAGLLSSTISSVSGASDVLKGSIVTYSKELKIAILKVVPEIIEKNTAESIETTTAMVIGLKEIFPSIDIHVAVTGVASPSTSTYLVDKKVGQIYVSIFYKDQLYKLDTVIPSEERNEIRQLTVYYILDNILSIVNRIN